MPRQLVLNVKELYTCSLDILTRSTICLEGEIGKTMLLGCDTDFVILFVEGSGNLLTSNVQQKILSGMYFKEED